MQPGICKGELSEVNPLDPELLRHPILFAVGGVETTAAAQPLVRPVEELACIALHERGFWGPVEPCDALRNEECIRRKARVVSLYWTRADVSIYVVTNLATERTAIMRTEEYYTSDIWSKS